ncbi:MAG: MmcQ/YjbR family DNA-binding protein [Lachnospiraceae bacterium]|jgi:predicted DNA-binding protein (MmcQ/YjbR family)|nr:MmcQ/YjbR family DNA-binding protein [Lachnospiraceae bacterium]
MTNEQITAWCLSQPGAYEDFPFGAIPICYKVCGKLFLQLYPELDNHKITISCEPMLADFYRQQYPFTVVPGYHCHGRLKPYMNTVYLNKDLDNTLIFDMIAHSYDRVVSKLTRREREELRRGYSPYGGR